MLAAEQEGGGGGNGAAAVDDASADATATAAAAPTGILDLSPACFVAVFGRLGAAETARAMCVHPLWAEYLRDDILWRPHLQTVFAKAEASLPEGGAAASFRCVDQTHVLNTVGVALTYPLLCFAAVC